MLTSGIGQVQPSVFAQIPPASNSTTNNIAKKMLLFLQTQLSLDEVFGL